MTVYLIDVSHHDSDRRGSPLDWGKVRSVGFSAMCAKATEGDPEGYHYADPTGSLNVVNASAAGFPLTGLYHCLSRGDAASIARQVDWLWSRIRAAGANWAMLDVEPFQELKDRGIVPRMSDVSAFVSRWRATTGTPITVYLPKWFWSQLGSPSLTGVTPIVSSDYGDNADGTYAALYAARGGDTGRGWGAYGGVTPAIWQYSSNANVPGASGNTDVNAFRGSLDELTALLTGDDMSLTPSEHANLVATDERVRVALIEGKDTYTDDGLGTVKPWIVTAVKQLAADVAALTDKPAVQAAPVDAAALKAVLLDPEVLARIATAVLDEQHRRDAD